MENLDMKWNLIDNFLEINFKKETNIILFGSNLEEFNKNSDIDILILSKRISTFTKEVFEYEEQIFDVILIPIHEIYCYLERDKFLKIYIDILCKGKILIDNEDVLKKIITQLKKTNIRENNYVRKIQIESYIMNLVRKMSNSKNIYEAEFFFNKIIDNIFALRLLDSGISNIDSSKHLIKKILEIDFKLVEYCYKLKKKLFQYQDISLILKCFKTELNINHLWNNEYYSNKPALSFIYQDNMVVYITKKSNLEKKMQQVLSLNAIPFYNFTIKNDNIYNEGSYFVITANKNELRNNILPFLEKVFFADKDLIVNDSKIIFPFLIDIQLMIGISNKKLYKEVETFFIILNELKSSKIVNIIFIIFYEILIQIKSDDIIEKLISIFAGKTTILNNSFHLSKSEQYLINLKNRYYNDKTIINISEINNFIYNLNLLKIHSSNSERIVNIGLQFKKIYNENMILDTVILYNILNMIFNIFYIENYQKPYIITLTKKIMTNDV